VSKQALFFRIEEIIVDASKLAEVLWLLTGKVRGMSPPQVMVNAKAERNGITPVSSGELIEMFTGWLRQHKLTDFTTKQTKEFLQSIGRSAGSASYLQTRAQEAGIIKNVSDSPTVGKWRLMDKVARAASKKPVRKTARPKARRSKAAADGAKVSS
jgi:hypothetical protein